MENIVLTPIQLEINKSGQLPHRVSRVVDGAYVPVCEPVNILINKEDIFVKRPVADESVTGLSVSKSFSKRLKKNVITCFSIFKKPFVKLKNTISAGFKNYKANIKRTYDHKIVFALIEKELFGKNSIDSITHDADKLFLYALGFPKRFVSKFHRKHSSHHVESGKNLNTKSMLCDMIASSPEFKPEKSLSLRRHYYACPEFSKVKGLKELLEKYNFGEDLNFERIKQLKTLKYHGFNGFNRALRRIASVVISAI